MRGAGGEGKHLVYEFAIEVNTRHHEKPHVSRRDRVKSPTSARLNSNFNLALSTKRWVNAGESQVRLKGEEKEAKAKKERVNSLPLSFDR